MASTNTTAPSPTSSSPPPPSPASPPPSKSPPAPPPHSPPPPRSPPPHRSPPPPKSKSNAGSSPVPPSSSKKSPPPHKSLTKSPPARKPSKHKNASTDHSQTNLPVILGVVIGVGLFLILLLISSLLAWIRKKRMKNRSPNYYFDAPPGPNKGGYYNGGLLPNWQNGAPNMEQMGKIPLPPGAMVPPGGSWHQAPPLPAMSSGDMSSGAYSGPYGHPLPSPSPSVSLCFSKSLFTFEELSAATNGFSQANLLGQGGFGYVHKGVLPNGKVVAVKQLKAGSGQGEREFKAEVEIISRVHHRHLVSLVGYSIAGQQRMLVYEFVPNQTLEFHLHGNNLLPTMDWPTRLKIALGSAKGLAYLHEDCHPRIIHRDIKASNILLDNKFEAMVADFGLAKLSNDTNTHVSTRVMGTFGYLAPEYALSGKLSEKSDVFSFGVMLLELITGRQPVDHTHTMEEEGLVDWARPLMTQALADDHFDELVDPRLENYDQTEMGRMIASAAACVRHSAKRRPKMSQIVRALEGDMSIEHLNDGIKPGDSMYFSSGSEYDSGSYTSKMRQLKRAESNDYTNGYSAGVNSEYGLDPSESGSSRETTSTGKQRNRTYVDD